MVTVGRSSVARRPARQEERPFALGPTDGDERPFHEYSPGPGWRLICTLNTYEKASLFQMSYALSRRFGWIYLGAPPDLAEFVRDWAAQEGRAWATALMPIAPASYTIPGLLLAGSRLPVAMGAGAADPLSLPPSARPPAPARRTAHRGGAARRFRERRTSRPDWVSSCCAAPTSCSHKVVALRRGQLAAGVAESFASPSLTSPRKEPGDTNSGTRTR